MSSDNFLPDLAEVGINSSEMVICFCGLNDCRKARAPLFVADLVEILRLRP
jgi:hypothetical protein